MRSCGSAAIRCGTVVADRRGSSTVEFAAAALIFFTFIFGIIEFGRVMWMQNALQYAVEQAARCAVVNTTTCGNSDAVKSYASSKTLGLSVPASAFSTGTGSCGTKISASYAFQFVLSALLPYSITLVASACYAT